MWSNGCKESESRLHSIFHLAGTKAFEVGRVRPDIKPASVTKLANQPCPVSSCSTRCFFRVALGENGNGSIVVRLLSSSIAAKCSLPVLSAGHSGGGGAAGGRRRVVTHWPTFSRSRPDRPGHQQHLLGHALLVLALLFKSIHLLICDWCTWFNHF